MLFNGLRSCLILSFSNRILSESFLFCFCSFFFVGAYTKHKGKKDRPIDGILLSTFHTIIDLCMKAIFCSMKWYFFLFLGRQMGELSMETVKYVLIPLISGSAFGKSESYSDMQPSAFNANYTKNCSFCIYMDIYTRGHVSLCYQNTKSSSK